MAIHLNFGSPKIRPVVLIFMFSSLAYFSLITTFSVYLNQYRGYSIALIGSLLFFYTLSSRLSKLLLGPLFDRLPFRATFCAAAMVAAAGFFAAGLWQDSLLGIWFLCLSGVGISSIVLLTQAYTACLVDERKGQIEGSDYSFIYILMNIAAVSAPLVGFFLIRRFAELYYLILALGYVALALVAWAWIQEPTRKRSAQTKNLFNFNWSVVLRNRPYLIFLAFNIVAWMFYANLFSTLPLYMTKILAGDQQLEWIYALEAILVVLLQHSVSKQLAKLPSQIFMPLTFIAFALSFVAFSLATNLIELLIAIALFSLALMVFMPSADALNVRFSSTDNVATYFGVLSLSAAIGDSIGSFFGLHALLLAERSATEAVYFLALAALALAAAALLYYMTRPLLSNSDDSYARPVD